MKLEQLLEMGRRVSPPDIDVDWERMRDGTFMGEYEAYSGAVYDVVWDPKAPDMIGWYDRKSDNHYTDTVQDFVYSMNREDDTGYQY